MQDINVLALVKGSERYVFLYDDVSRAETLRVLGRYASNPELSFTWYDAAVLSQKIRQESQKQAHAARFEVPLPTDQDDPFQYMPPKDTLDNLFRPGEGDDFDGDFDGEDHTMY